MNSLDLDPAKLELFDTAPPAAATSGLGAIKAATLSTASALLLPLMSRVAPDSVGGESLDDAWAVVERLQARGLAHTLGFWDTPAYSPAEVAAIYAASVERISASGHDGYLSIKPPALRFEAAAARELAKAAARAGVRVHCDSHGTNVADLTFGFIEALLGELPPALVSVTLPGRWTRSHADAQRIADWGIGARIVKGEWPDPARPDHDLRTGFLEAVDRMAGLGGRVAVATHDVGLAEASLARLGAAGVERELEFIFGSQSDRLLDLAARTGVPARCYVPFGRGFVPSALRALRRDPSILVDMLRHMVGLRGRAAATS